MCYYDEDDFFEYYEPNELEIVLDEVKDRLNKYLKDEVKDKINRLESENKQLKEELDLFIKNKQEFEQEKRSLEYQKQNLNHNFVETKFTELLEKHIIQCEIWCISRESFRNNKCNKCDEERKIEYVSPYGDKMHLDCNCNVFCSKDVPIKRVLDSISFVKGKRYSNKSYELIAKPKYFNSHNDAFYCDFEFERLITEFDENLEINRFSDSFATRELCEQYIDHLNLSE